MPLDGSGGQLSFDHSQVATEALLMKMKIFRGSDLQSLESKINEWLEAKGINLIHHITHANNLSTTIITVWWGEQGLVYDSLTDVGSTHTCEVHPRKDQPGVNLIFRCPAIWQAVWYGEPNAVSHAIDYAQHRCRSRNAVIRVYDDSGNIIETHEHAGDFKEPLLT